MADEKKGITIYLSVEEKEEIENFFLDCRIKNYQEGYRDVVALGFKEFKKLKGGK